MQTPTSPLRLTFLALASTTVSGYVQPNSPTSPRMQLYLPAPYNASNNPHRQTAPDNSLGTPFNISDSPEAYLYPCRGYTRLFGTEQGAPTATWAAGSDQSWSLQGEGNTTDGSCYIVFVNENETDNQDNGDTSDFQVVEPAVGGYQGNCIAPHPGTDSYTQEFNFTVPENLPFGVTTFAWIWDNGGGSFNVNCAAVNITTPDSRSGSNPGGPQPYGTSSYAYSLASTTTRNSLNQTSTTFIAIPKTSTIVTTTTFTPSTSSSSLTRIGSGSTTSPAFSIEWTTVTVTQQANSTGSVGSSLSISISSTTDMGSTIIPQTASIGPGAIPMFPTTPARSATTFSQVQSFGGESSTSTSSTSSTTETTNTGTLQTESMGSGGSTPPASSITQTTSPFVPQAESLGPASNIPLPPTQTQSFSNQSITGTSLTSSTTEMSVTTTAQTESTGTANSLLSSTTSSVVQTTRPFVPQAESLGPGSSVPLSLPPTTTQTTTTVTPTPANSFSTGGGSLTTPASLSSTETPSPIEDTTTVFSISTTTTTQVIDSAPMASISTTIAGLSGISSLLYSATPPLSSLEPSSIAVYSSPATSSSSGGTTTVKSTTTITPGASGLPDSIGASSSGPWISFLTPYLTPTISYHSAPVFSASQIISNLPVSSSGVIPTSLEGVTYTSTTTTVWRTVTDYTAPSSAPALNSSASSSFSPLASIGVDKTNNTSHFWTANHCSCACPAGEADIAHCNCFCPLPHGLQNKMNTTAKFKFEKSAVRAEDNDGAARPDDRNVPYRRFDRVKRGEKARL